jgi:hypothetical protein
MLDGGFLYTMNSTRVSGGSSIQYPTRCCATILLFLLAVALLPSAGDAPGEQQNETPNIVLRLVDDMGYSDISAFGPDPL